MHKGNSNTTKNVWTNTQLKYVNFGAALCMAGMEMGATFMYERVSACETAVYLVTDDDRGVLRAATARYITTVSFKSTFSAHMLAVYRANKINFPPADSIYAAVTATKTLPPSALPVPREILFVTPPSAPCVLEFDTHTWDVHTRYKHYLERGEITSQQLYELYVASKHITTTSVCPGIQNIAPSLQYFMRVICACVLKHVVKQSPSLIKFGCYDREVAKSFVDSVLADNDMTDVYIRHSYQFDAKAAHIASIVQPDHVFECYMDHQLQYKDLDNCRSLLCLVIEYDAWVGYGYVDKPEGTTLLDTAQKIMDIVTQAHGKEDRLEFYRQKSATTTTAKDLTKHTGMAAAEELVVYFVDKYCTSEDKLSPGLQNPQEYNAAYRKCVLLFDDETAKRAMSNVLKVHPTIVNNKNSWAAA